MSLTDITSLPCPSAAFAGLSADILRHGKSLRFRARGASMQPLVREGDCLLVSPVDSRSIRVGDIVLCSSEPDHVVVHRVVRRQFGTNGWRFLVQGDQVRQPDGWVLQPQLYGRVTVLERAGEVIDLQQPWMRILGRLAAMRSRIGLARLKMFHWLGNCLFFYRHSA